MAPPNVLRAINPRHNPTQETLNRLLEQPAKTRVSIYLDDDLLKRLRERADAAGCGYQAIVNEAVREYLARLERRPLGRRVEIR
jgi:uncharacterized protein (DUF4415 family)